MMNVVRWSRRVTKHRTDVESFKRRLWCTVCRGRPKLQSVVPTHVLSLERVSVAVHALVLAFAFRAAFACYLSS